MSILCQSDTEIIYSEKYSYRQTSNVNRTLLGNEIVHHSDVIEASPVRAALTTFYSST